MRASTRAPTSAGPHNGDEWVLPLPPTQDPKGAGSGAAGSSPPGTRRAGRASPSEHAQRAATQNAGGGCHPPGSQEAQAPLRAAGRGRALERHSPPGSRHVRPAPASREVRHQLRPGRSLCGGRSLGGAGAGLGEPEPRGTPGGGALRGGASLCSMAQGYSEGRGRGGRACPEGGDASILQPPDLESQPALGGTPGGGSP